MSVTAIELLVDRVLAQIVKDVNSGDLTAVQELILNCPVTALETFLPEIAVDE